MRLELASKGTTALNAVDTATAKTHLRVTISEDDTLISNLVAVATDVARVKTGRTFIQSAVSYYLDGWPEDDLVLPYPPFKASSMTITYTDENGDTQTLAGTVYRVDGTDPGILRLGWDQSWPTHRSVEEAIKLAYTAGYGTAMASVPTPIQQAILLHVGHLYEHREAVDIINAAAIMLPFGYDALIAAYKWPVIEGRW